MTSMSSAPRWSAAPMPDSISSCGVPMLPADRMTSLRARTICAPPSVAMDTPIARWFSTTTFSAWAPVLMVRFLRDFAGRSQASAADQR